MIKQIASRVKLVMEDRRWWGFFIQRRFMRPARRDRLADFVASRRPQARPAPPSPELEQAVRELSTQGFAMLGQLLDTSACAELRHYFAGCKVSDPYRAGIQNFLPDSPDRHPEAHVAWHEAADVLKAPHLISLANDERVLGIVSRFLGCKPTIGYFTAWWSYPTARGPQQAEFFHRDVDDWRFVKLFVYLTDVGPENGPHVYVQHSATSDKLTQIRRFTDDEVREAFGAENLLSMTASAGQGFLENTFGIHKGQPVASGRRLIFQTVYGVSPLPYGPTAPVLSRAALGRTDLDPWINRIYLS